MELDTNTLVKEKTYSKGFTHFVLSHSYLIFLMAVVLGAIFDLFLPAAWFSKHNYDYIGVILLLVGPGLIFWAQSSSKASKENAKRDNTLMNFESGPYKYTRNPTHIGLTVLSLGFALLINSLFSVIFLIIASTVSKHIFVKKQEEILEDKYGQAYRDYKAKVHGWI
jgi:protein-S-isoprenylcysteine O-methyltransferase Ste14